MRNIGGKHHYVEIFGDLQLTVRDERDAKDVCAEVRYNEVIGFASIDDLYEEPLHAEIRMVRSSILLKIFRDRSWIISCKPD